MRYTIIFSMIGVIILLLSATIISSLTAQSISSSSNTCQGDNEIKQAYMYSVGYAVTTAIISGLLAGIVIYLIFFEKKYPLPL